MARLLRTQPATTGLLGRASGSTFLGPPVVVGQGIVFPPIQGYLFPAGDVQQRLRQRPAEYRLRPPTVVTQPAPFVARPVKVQLVASPRQARAAHSRLRPPTVIDLRPQTVYLSVNLTYSRRGVPKSVLRRPTDTIGLEDQGHVRVTLAPSARQGRASHWALRPPVVIDLTPQTRYLNVNLAYSRRGAPRSRLVPPAVVAAAFYPRPVVTHLSYSVRKRGQSRLFPPAVVTQVSAPVFYGPQVTAAPQPKPFSRHTLFPPAAVDQGIVFSPIQGTLFSLRSPFVPPVKSRLFAPTVVGSPFVFVAAPVRVTLVAVRTRTEQPSHRTMAGVRTPVFVGAGIYFRPILVHLAPQSRGRALSRLSPPRVVTQVVVQVFYVGKPAFARVPPRRVQSVLRPPRVVYLAVEIYGPVVWLARNKPQPTTHKLTPPTVVDVRVYFGPAVTLAYSRRGAPKSVLRPPVVIDLRPQAYYLTVSLAYSRRGTPKSRLEPPTVVDVRVYTGPAVTLAYSVRGRPVYRLRPPVVIDLRPQVYYLTVSLAASRRGQPKSELRPPTVISTDRFFGPTVHLTPSRRPKARYGLAAPAVVSIPAPVLYPVQVTLAYSLRGKPKSLLRKPTVVGAVVYYGPSVNLAYSRRGAPRSALQPPAVIARAVFSGPQATLAYSRRGRPVYELRPPTVIDLRPQVYYLSVTLARITPPPTLSRLSPPTTTEALPRAERDLRITLAYQSRGRPKSILRKPVVIDLRPQVYYLAVTLAYSRRGKAKSRLSFVAGQRIVFFGPQTTLAYSVRGRPESRLSKPVVVRVFVAPATAVHLAYSRRGRPVYRLRPPTRVQAFIARPIDITLAYQSRGKPRSRLVPPTVVRIPENRRTRVTLTRIVPAPTVATLRPPAVVRVGENRRTRVTFAYQSRGVAKYRLAAPAVVAPAPLARAIQVTLVRIRPPKRFWRLSPPAVVQTFIPPGGEVCDFTSTDTEVCDDTASTDEVCDTTGDGSLVVGSDTTESRITGGDTAVDAVCDSNEKAT